MLYREIAGLAIYVPRANVPDAALKELGALKHLRSLNLFGAEVTDAGLKELVPLPIESLYLDYARKVTDDGLKNLAGMKKLRSLNLMSTAITEAGLKDLAPLPLESLALSLTNVSNAGMKDVANLKQLRTLILFSTAVTDAGLKELVGLKSLQWLDLFGSTRVTNTGAAELRKALPACQVSQ